MTPRQPAVPPLSCRIGTAGWSLPATLRLSLPPAASGLARYAGCFDAVEINTSFYRPHQPATYARWADTTPTPFAFAVKVPRAITHEARLARPHAALAGFLAQCTALGDKLGVLLVQLPPSLAFEPRVAARFFAAFRTLHRGAITVEPRHRSWFEPSATDLLHRHRIGRVAADPACCTEASGPIAADDVAYFRLHGSPRMYWSEYGIERLRDLAEAVRGTAARGVTPWVIFDNTAAQAAAPDALRLSRLLGAKAPSAPD